jgi:hypothetical protein
VRTRDGGNLDQAPGKGSENALFLSAQVADFSGATAVIQQAVRYGGRASSWLVDLLKRKPPKLAAVALANKMARVAWKLMVTGEAYIPKSAPAVQASAA